ncbi:MAG: nucleotide exchange factor GrpE [Candidatus Kapabacteria bacterium]|nr:nucleotide exchange factor GrpE [Candidatus Kapabacteria bacterium]
MEEEQKSQKNVTNKMKDLYNTYLRQDEKKPVGNSENTVKAETQSDINDVHAPTEGGAEQEQSATESAAEISPIMKEIESLRLAITEAEKERDENRDKLLRNVAEFENYRRRTEREKEQLLLFASERTLSKLVSIIDDLHAAVDAGEKSKDYESMFSGLKMIYTKAMKMYEEHGVKPLEVEPGEPFNVDVHEALMHIPHPDTPEGHIVQQIQRGYMLHDKVIRHAKVVTSAGSGE